MSYMLRSRLVIKISCVYVLLAFFFMCSVNESLASLHGQLIERDGKWQFSNIDNKGYGEVDLYNTSKIPYRYDTAKHECGYIFYRNSPGKPCRSGEFRHVSVKFLSTLAIWIGSAGIGMILGAVDAETYFDQEEYLDAVNEAMKVSNIADILSEYSSYSQAAINDADNYNKAMNISASEIRSRVMNKNNKWLKGNEHVIKEDDEVIPEFTFNKTYLKQFDIEPQYALDKIKKLSKEMEAEHESDMKMKQDVLSKYETDLLNAIAKSEEKARIRIETVKLEEEQKEKALALKKQEEEAQQLKEQADIIAELKHKDIYVGKSLWLKHPKFGLPGLTKVKITGIILEKKDEGSKYYTYTSKNIILKVNCEDYDVSELTYGNYINEIPEDFHTNNVGAKWGKRVLTTIANGKVFIGMTKPQVIASWGQPSDINRTAGSWGVHEQWVYGSNYLYFENGILKSWQD